MAMTTGIKQSRKTADRVFGFLCFFAVFVAVTVLGWLLVSIFTDGFSRLSPAFLDTFTSRLPEKAGVKAALFGSVWIVLLTGAISVPVGIAAAIYLEEFTRRKNWFTEFIEVNIANLAGVPSIVYGLLGLALFVRTLSMDRSILAGSLTMSLLILPMIILVTREALRAVPDSLRQGSLALGSTQWQTIYRQVVPVAAPGIFTGIILSLSRAMGETAPLVTIGAVAYIGFVPRNVNDKFTVLPLQIYDWSSRPQQGYHDAAAAAIIVLLVVLLTLNAFAIFLRQRSQNKQ